MSDWKLLGQCPVTGIRWLVLREGRYPSVPRINEVRNSRLYRAPDRTFILSREVGAADVVTGGDGSQCPPEGKPGHSQCGSR